MSRPEDSLLGREVAYPREYDPTLLFPIPRAAARAALGIAAGPLPFDGHDRWHAYELSWLEADRRPVSETATLMVPADSPNLVESKSLKLYLGSLNRERFDGRDAVRERIAADLSAAAGAAVTVAFGLPPVDARADVHESIDAVEVPGGFAPAAGPDPSLLAADPGDEAAEALCSSLLKSNCPVTGQPDWASLRIAYRGPRIDRAGLLRYIASYREHAGFHEQCVEQVYRDLVARCAPASLSVEARYTRRGGLDINPWRATPGVPPPRPGRDPRQ